MTRFSLHLDGRRAYLTPEERERFIEAAYAQERPFVRTFCLTLAATGARLSELCRLTNRQVDVAGKKIFFQGKGRNTRAIPIPSSLMETLIEVHGLRSGCNDGDHEQRFWPNCGRETGTRWTREVMKKAGLNLKGPAATSKGLRHAFAINALEKGVPIEIVQQWMGHSSIRITAAYAPIAEEIRKQDYAENIWITTHPVQSGL